DQVGLGNLLLQDFIGAESYFLSAISIDAQLTQAYLHLGQTYLGQGRFQEAQKALETVLEQGGASVDNARRLLQYYFPDSH
ncbi:MAG: tetratricopeptide repeat protein, partial [Anaerolineaceae bacterium]|nr:tetratricopeptide repeat protein [Anaerolineaceae bacterium]